MKVWIVLEGPDMTYYDDAEIHGVFDNEEAARMRLVKVNPRGVDCTDMAEYEIESAAEPVRQCETCKGRQYVFVGQVTAASLFTGVGRQSKRCETCKGNGWVPA